MIGRRPHALAFVLGAASLCNSLPDDSAYTTPTFLWAEKKDMLIVTVLAFGSFAQVDFEDTAVRVALKPKEDGKQNYLLDLKPLLFSINKKKSTWAIERSGVVLRMRKKESRRWGKLLRDDNSPLAKLMKVDWEKMDVDDDEEDEAADDAQSDGAEAEGKGKKGKKRKKEKQPKRLSWIAKDGKEDLACRACSAVVDGMEAKLAKLREGNETILVERKKKDRIKKGEELSMKKSIPYADSRALVSDMLEDICDDSAMWERYKTVKSDGVTLFLPKSKAPKKKKEAKPAATALLPSICKSIVADFEEDMAELFYSKRAKANFNFDFKICHVMAKACVEDSPPPPPDEKAATEKAEEAAPAERASDEAPPAAAKGKKEGKKKESRAEL